MSNKAASPDPNGPDPAVDDAAADETKRFAAKLQQAALSWSATGRNAADDSEDAAQALAMQQVKAAMSATKEAAKDRAAAKAKAEAAKPVTRKPGPFSMSYEGLDTTKQNPGGRPPRSR